MATQRDGFVDFFKGMLILWVIHIHTVFWSGQHYIPEIARQASLLVDVATFVFISGYLTRLTDFKSSIQKAVKQFVNLYSNYLIFSCLLLVPLYFAFLVKDKSIPDLLFAVLSMLRVDPMGELWGDIPVYHGSLWYMAVYFSSLLLVPFAIGFANSRPRRIIALALSFVLFCLSSHLDWQYNLFFYQAPFVFFFLFVYILGMVYRAEEEKISTSTLKLTFLFNIALSSAIFFHLDQGVFDLQSEKFPPSLEYFVHSLLLMHIFVLTKRLWRYPSPGSANKVLLFLEWCGKNVYFIYLLQAVVCSIPLYFVPVVKDSIPELVLYLIVLLFNLVFTLISTYIYLNLKDRVTNFVKTKTAPSSI